MCVCVCVCVCACVCDSCARALAGGRYRRGGCRNELARTGLTGLSSNSSKCRSKVRPPLRAKTTGTVCASGFVVCLPARACGWVGSRANAHVRVSKYESVHLRAHVCLCLSNPGRAGCSIDYTPPHPANIDLARPLRVVSNGTCALPYDGQSACDRLAPPRARWNPIHSWFVLRQAWRWRVLHTRPSRSFLRRICQRARFCPRRSLQRRARWSLCTTARVYCTSLAD